MSAASDLARRLASPGGPSPLAGDFAREEDYGDALRAPTPAAVLVAVTDRPDPTILLTRRHRDLRHHAGQVALPGGRLDAGEDARTAALREAWEEIALDPDAVCVAGVGDAYRTGTNFSVTPVIGSVPPDLPLVPSEAEVEAVFELPASRLLDPACYREERGVWQGLERRYWVLDGEGDERVWGATAAILLNLARRLR